MIIKNCGLNSPESVVASVTSGAEYLGFILHPPSPRYVTAEQAAALTESLPPDIKCVAVMINPAQEAIEQLLSVWQPDYLQLHGEESPQTCRDIHQQTGLPIIKAVGIATETDVEKIHRYEGVADMLLLDTKTGDKSGGTGQVFDWSLLQQLDIHTPWFLAGGLHIGNVEDAIRITGAQRIDVSSGLESSPGVKDPGKIRAFNQFAKTLQPAV